MLLSQEEYASLFSGENVLTDNSFFGISEDKLLEHLRKNNKENIEIYSLNGINEGSKELLSILNATYTLHSKSDILKIAESSNIPRVEVNIKHRKSTLKQAIKSKSFEKFTLKYGIFLMLFSIISQFKIYYIVFGATMLAYSIYLKIKRKLSQQSQTRDLLS